MAKSHTASGHPNRPTQRRPPPTRTQRFAEVRRAGLLPATVRLNAEHCTRPPATAVTPGTQGNAGRHARRSVRRFGITLSITVGVVLGDPLTGADTTNVTCCPYAR